MEATAAGEDQQRRDDLVQSFCGVTSATREVAVFLLESHSWILDAAIAAFYEQEDQDQDQDPGRDLLIPRSRSRSRGVDDDDEEEDEDKDDEDYLPQEVVPPPPRATRSSAANPPRSAPSRAEKRPEKPSGSRSNIRTFADLNRSSGPGSETDSDDEPQGFYTGGEKSGMLVQDPKKGRHDVDSLFEHARQMGAMPGPFEPQPSSHSRSFTGTGRLLSGETVQSTPQQPTEVNHSIYVWRNGFTVDDGPLRRFDDPENASFLQSVARSECPKELEPANTSTVVNVNLIRKEAEYSEPVRRPGPFQGTGRTLGSGSSSSLVSETAVSSDNAPSPSVGLSVDDSKPSTTVQLRLADGTRMVARFNTYHTVGDIRAFIDSSRPGAARTYQLQTVGFPPMQLDDLTETIEEAGLANSVIIQRR